MPESSAADAPTVGDHVRPSDGAVEAGVYRVVGTPDDAVTLLRVGDGEGHRVHTGVVVSVDHDALAGFESAESPDASRSRGAAIGSLLRHLYWSLRAFGRSLAANPLPSALGLALVLAGQFGGGVLPLPDVALGVVTAVGAFALAYVGSGRL